MRLMPQLRYQLADRDEAKAWMIKNQLGRRNLIPAMRVKLELALKPLVIAKAKEKEHERKTTCPNLDESSFVCKCGESFSAQVWHCPVCAHHWPLTKDECSNCHEGKKRGSHKAAKVGSIDSLSEIAKSAGVSRGTVHKVERVLASSNESVKADMLAGRT